MPKNECVVKSLTLVHPKITAEEEPTVTNPMFNGRRHHLTEAHSVRVQMLLSAALAPILSRANTAIGECLFWGRLL